MLENDDREIDVAEVMAGIKHEVANRGKGNLNMGSWNIYHSVGTNKSFDWQQIAERLSIAEQNADAGSRVLPMLRFHKSIRWIIRLIGRIVIYLAQVVTIPQRNFNYSIFQSLRSALEGVRSMNSGLAGLSNRVAALEEDVAERDNRIALLEKGLAERDQRISALEEVLSKQIIN